MATQSRKEALEERIRDLRINLIKELQSNKPSQKYIDDLRASIATCEYNLANIDKPVQIIG